MSTARTLVARVTAAVAFARLGGFVVLHASLPLPLLTQALIADVASYGLLGLLLGLIFGLRRPWALCVAGVIAALAQFGLSHAGATRALAAIPAAAGYGLLAGALIGIAQLPLMWRALKHPPLWPVTLALGWGLAYAVAWIIAEIALESSPGQFTVILGAGDALASMIIGGITGVSFILLGGTHERARRVDESGQEHRG